MEDVICVSDYNKKVLETMNIEGIKIFDTTLRDGEQTPGVAFSIEEKVKMAESLDLLGVDAIEAGFPITSAGEKEAIKKICDMGLKAKICGLARSNKKDIDVALDCNVDRVHTFIATSPLHREFKLKMSKEEIMARAIEGVEYAKDHGVEVEFSCEDATRTELEYLKEMHRAVRDVGVDYINVPDTVGTIMPKAMRYLIKELVNDINVPISIHCHNDFGLAVANSLAAVESGAKQIHCTINGLGERAGNASLEEIVMSLMALYGVRVSLDTTRLTYISKLVSRISGVVVQPNKAIVGENAFAHESGIHVHGVLSKAFCYEPLTPKLVGKESEIVVGKHTGLHAVEKKLRDFGIGLTRDQILEIVEDIKLIREGGKKITDEDLIAIAAGYVGKVPDEEKEVKLEEMSIISGLRITPTATAILNINGTKKVGSNIGNGAVDAALNALKSIVPEKITLEEYRLEAITGGSDALCQVSVKMANEAGIKALGKSVGPDIVMTSVNAAIEAINKLRKINKEGKTQ
ncbi:MAG: 2-isopropylmalate synthase [Candidatus Methanofastidiosum methylothiophilum]|uniref:Probable 2-isopropylmalate synthase n=1 Tax=Candidatus Methanofastidiosum methylothiophilum TaxID=1705564 RepID=A0A150JDV2_9EURY|nr:MAG: 2-isopropylmalate synthase [Candidatus Methanofastidiosum methylthiophilus]MBP6932287.1 2-isopropylmalate synthase [Methanofastidiosum sp.]NLH34402.1 2-isopropylmalate synthase [Lentimicrobium sp.]OQC51549.1 MAG: 2-isopropylmalate synthase [Euryarchaeota archaeon ADurb.Bin023]KYC57023.1 MAG: 2-isopropylmalate synthase [Candidatus Methanofastidiosum methylthiophilus]